MKTVLFVCVENSCRSQMAEAFASMLGPGVIQAYSSGSRPSGKVNEKAIASMKEVGYDLSNHRSKSLADVPTIEYDAVVTMGCGDECQAIPAKRRLEWDIPDPKQLDAKRFGEVRDLIKHKVQRLIDDIRGPSRKFTLP
ncbi:MAG: arsenate reductase ArsC [Nitrospirota bacterium]